MIAVLRTPFLVAVALAVAFSGGIWSSLAALDATETFGGLTIGPWETNPLAQTAAADPYAKAQRAREGAFALGQAEGLVFRATSDSAGRPLDRRCSYRLAGQVPAARVWVLHLVASDGRPLPAQRYFPTSLHANGLSRAADGSFEIALDETARSGNWLKLTGSGPFAIEITLFDTPAAGNFGLVDLDMPRLERLECGDA